MSSHCGTYCPVYADARNSYDVVHQRLKEFDDGDSPDLLSLYFHYRDKAFDCYNAKEYTAQLVRSNVHASARAHDVQYGYLTHIRTKFVLHRPLAHVCTHKHSASIRRTRC